MNTILLTGRLTRDPEVRYSGELAVARFTLAVNRGKDKNGNDVADFPSIVAFGKTAELVEKYVTKGMLVCVGGKIQTGSYEKDGQMYYTTSVVADRIEFMERKKETPEDKVVEKETPEDIYSCFSKLDEEDIPF